MRCTLPSYPHLLIIVLACEEEFRIGSDVVYTSCSLNPIYYWKPDVQKD
jgi:hypothetical protein